MAYPQFLKQSPMLAQWDGKEDIMATLKMSKEGVTDLKSLTQFVFQNMDRIFNGIDFLENSRGKSGNFDAETITFNSTGANQVFKHRLERIPVGILVVEKDAFCDVLTDAKDDKSITLKASASGVTIKVIVI